MLSPRLDWDEAAPKWAQELNPLLSNPLNAQKIISVTLETGANIINHGLGRRPLGWSILDITSAATVYRSAPFNPTTLTLTASAPVNLKIGVF